MNGNEATRRTGLAAPAVWLLAFVLLTGGETLAVLNRTVADEAWTEQSWLFLLVSFALTALGALIVAHHPRHAVGWLLCTVGLLFEASFLASEYSYFTLITEPGALPAERAVTTISWFGGTAFFAMTCLLLLLFPDGRPPSRRWVVFVYLGLAATTAASLGEILKPGPLPEPLEAWSNPTGVPGAHDLMVVVNAIGMSGVALCGVAGAASLIVRFRNAEGAPREQLKWVVFGAVVFMSLWLLAIVGAAVGVSPALRQGLVVVGLSTIPLAAAVAILRYRLYDIDAIVNRTLVYVPLTAILAGVYIAITGLSRALLTEETGATSDAAIAFTTVVVVAMLTPVKNYLQEHVDRRFKQAADPAGDLQRFAEQTREAVSVLDSDQFVRRFIERTVTIMKASGATVRIEDAGRQRVFSLGELDGRRAMVLTLCHEGTDIGFCYVGYRASGRPYTDDERAALEASMDTLAYIVSLTAGRHVPRERSELVSS